MGFIQKKLKDGISYLEDILYDDYFTKKISIK